MFARIADNLCHYLAKRATKGGKILPSRHTALISPFRIVLKQLSTRFRLDGLTRQLGSLPSADNPLGIQGSYPKSVISVQPAVATGRSSDRWPR